MPGPGQILQRLIATEVAKLRAFTGIEVVFRWVPGHSDILENEAADAAAKHGTSHRCLAPPLRGCANPVCSPLPWTSLAHVNRAVTEIPKAIASKWVRQRTDLHAAYRPRKKWGIRDGLKTVPKHRAAVFYQIASGHALIGTHLVRIKKKDSDRCWWCDSGERQTRGHLFGACDRWQREYEVLAQEVEKITGKPRRRRGRLKAVEIFSDDRLTKAILEFLAATEVGRRYVE